MSEKQGANRDDAVDAVNVRQGRRVKGIITVLVVSIALAVVAIAIAFFLGQ